MLVKPPGNVIENPAFVPELAGKGGGRGRFIPTKTLSGIVVNEGQKMTDVSERVKKIVVEHLGVDEGKVTESASFIDDLGADSLDTVELVMAFEEEFGCEIPDEAAEKIVTVKDAIQFIEQHV